jgi:hypothetical protein
MAAPKRAGGALDTETRVQLMPSNVQLSPRVVSVWPLAVKPPKRTSLPVWVLPLDEEEELLLDEDEEVLLLEAVTIQVLLEQVSPALQVSLP